MAYCEKTPSKKNSCFKYVIIHLAYQQTKSRIKQVNYSIFFEKTITKQNIFEVCNITEF